MHNRTMSDQTGFNAPLEVTLNATQPAPPAETPAPGGPGETLPILAPPETPAPKEPTPVPDLPQQPDAPPPMPNPAAPPQPEELPPVAPGVG